MALQANWLGVVKLYVGQDWVNTGNSAVTSQPDPGSTFYFRGSNITLHLDGMSSGGVPTSLAGRDKNEKKVSQVNTLSNVCLLEVKCEENVPSEGGGMSDDVFACRGGDTVPRVVQHLQHPGKDAEGDGGDGPRGMRDINMLVFIPNPDRRKPSPSLQESS